MKAIHNQLEISQILERNRSATPRVVSRNSGMQGYRPPNQALEFACRRAEPLRKASKVPESTFQVESYFLRMDWSLEKIAGKITVSHETRSCVGHREGGIVSVYENKRGLRYCQRLRTRSLTLGSSKFLPSSKTMQLGALTKLMTTEINLPE